ncbi:MAG: HlyD family efflux transporter periplasmic adaptor subunit, partial [Clostridiales bacterium]
MAEEKTLKRGWVKNAAIVFLIIMLLLTFFSNTFLNRSLPEVAVQYAQAGTITAKIRGTGTVAANKNYEVILNQTRKVEAVAVKVGDTVAFGDILFILGDAESDELKQAKEALATLNLDYRKTLIDSSSGDYAKETRAIQVAERDLKKAVGDRDSNYVTDADVNNAKARVTTTKNQLADCTAKVADFQATLDSLTKVDSSQILALERQIEDKEAAINALDGEYRKVGLVHATAYGKFKSYASRECGGTNTYQLAAAAELMDARISELKADNGAGSSGLTADQETELKDLMAQLAAYRAYDKVDMAKNDLQKELDRLEEDYDELSAKDNSAEYNSVNKKLRAAKDEEKIATQNQTNAVDSLTMLTEKQIAYKAALVDVAQAQKSVDDLTFQLAQTKKDDGKTSAKTSLELQNMRIKIDEKQKEVNLLQKDSVGATITAPMAGIVKTINVAAGANSEINQPLAVIESPDNGYSLSFPVTMEQSKRVQLGDSGEIINYYWGNDIKANLAQIKNDPEKPGQGKILVFSLTGEVEAGTQYTISIGQKSANYDVIVPNSALRSDSNGDFILMVTAKSTPLGNRYIATRVDVKILATDDTNSAISGGPTSWDYVITTSS